MFQSMVPFLVLSSMVIRNARGQIQSNATCSSDFTWMQNSKNQSPCTVAGYVNAACLGNSYDVGALLPNNHYNNTLNPTPCSCSWAAYNLFSACTICQGQPASVLNWPPWIEACGDMTSDTYFPPNETLSSNTAIPFWAGTDPTTWPDEQFDASQAQTIANQGKADLTPPRAFTKKTSNKAPVGAIVGGVIGGLVILAITGGITMLIIRRRNIAQRNNALANPRHPTRPFSMFSGHGRSASDLSQRSFGNSIGYSDAMSLSGPQQQPVPGVHGLTYVPVSMSSAMARHGHSYSASTNSSPHPANSRYTASPSPPPGMAFNHPPSSDPANIIEPFVVVSQSPSPEPRKGSAGAVYPIYGAPSSPPDPVQRTPPETTTPQRRRINPPAYSVDHAATDEPSVIHTTRDDLPTTPTQNTTLTPTPTARVIYPREKGGTDVRTTPARDGNLSPPPQIVLSPPTRGLRPYAPSSIGPPMTTRDDNSTHMGHSRSNSTESIAM